MAGRAAALPPYPGSDYSAAFAAYIQHLRARHLIFHEPDIEWACVETHAEKTAAGDGLATVTYDDSFSYQFLALRLPAGLLDDYLVPPGLSLLDGMLYSATSLEIVEF